jgi:molybdopterin biosynthesis enzyme
MRIVRVVPGEPVPATLAPTDEAALARTTLVGDERWTKGRRLDAAAIARLVQEVPDPHPVTLLVLEPGDLHEDEAAVRLARAVAGRGLEMRGPSESRIDLVAAHDGVLRVRIGALERADRIDAVEVFTRLDGQVVSAGDIVASVKVAPHVVPGALVEAAERAIGRTPLVRVRPYRRWLVGVVVKEAIHAPARERFEASVRQRVEGLGSVVGPVVYAAHTADAVTDALAGMTRGAGAVQLILTAGSASTDPMDAFFTAIDRLGGLVVRRGVPAHPGSMLWMARVAQTTILGLPTCGAYSKATAVDLLVPWLLAGAPPTRATVARLGHGGVLTRDQRFRFPAYASELDAPDG